MGKIVVKTFVLEEHLEMQIMRILRSIAGLDVCIQISPRGIGIATSYTVEGEGVPDLGECQVTVSEELKKSAGRVGIIHTYTLEPLKNG